MTLYMAVTADRYELPVAVESNMEILANKMGSTKNNIYSQLCRQPKREKTERKRDSRTGKVRYVRVTVVDED